MTENTADTADTVNGTPEPARTDPRVPENIGPYLGELDAVNWFRWSAPNTPLKPGFPDDHRRSLLNYSLGYFLASSESTPYERATTRRIAETLSDGELMVLVGWLARAYRAGRAEPDVQRAKDATWADHQMSAPIVVASEHAIEYKLDCSCGWGTTWHVTEELARKDFSDHRYTARQAAGDAARSKVRV